MIDKDKCLKLCGEEPSCSCCEHFMVEDHCDCELCGGGSSYYCRLTGKFLLLDDNEICDNIICGQRNNR